MRQNVNNEDNMSLPIGGPLKIITNACQNRFQISN